MQSHYRIELLSGLTFEVICKVTEIDSICELLGWDEIKSCEGL
jgi:hypothetical protein